MLNKLSFKALIVTLLTIYSHAAYADWTIDELMSSRDKKRTGVAKLTPRQKRALQTWMHKHFILKGTEVAEKQKEEDKAQKAAKAAHVTEIIQSGKYLRLSNNSVWEIHPADRATVEGWMTPANILVTTSKNSRYPYLLENEITKTKVLAKKVAPLIESDQDAVNTNIQGTK